MADVTAGVRWGPTATMSELRDRARETPLALLVLGCVALFGILVVLHDVLSLVGLVVWIGFIAIAVRPIVGLYVAFLLAVLFEAGADPHMAFGNILNGGLTGTAGISGAVANPFELLLLATFASWIFQGIAQRRSALRGGDLGWPVLFFTLALIAGFIRGAIAGGDMFIGIFECRYLFYVPLCYILAANTIRSFAHVRTLVALMLIATGLFGLEGAYRKVVLIDGHQLNVIQEFAYQHVDVIFLSSAIVLVFALIGFGSRAGYRVIGIAALPVMAFTMLASQRRAGFIAILVALAAFAIVLLWTKRKAFFFMMVPLLLGTAVYMPVFWNDTGLIGQPARAVRSITEPDARDAASNTARLLEKLNVVATIKGDPLLGVGFGREYTFVVPGVDLSWWPLWHYVAHANVIWVWMKVGLLGFVAFWVLMGGAIVRAVQLARVLTGPEERAFAVLALTTVITTLVFSYVDIGLLSGRTMILLGTVLGTLGVLGRLGVDAQVKQADVVSTRRRTRLVAGVPVTDSGA
jgi:hypothetical protein